MGTGARASRAGIGKLTTETLSFHRRAARDIGTRLAQDDFAFAGTNALTLSGTATLGANRTLTITAGNLTLSGGVAGN